MVLLLSNDQRTKPPHSANPSAGFINKLKRSLLYIYGDAMSFVWCPHKISPRPGTNTFLC